MPRLSVNVNKLALLRNSRDGKGPDVVRLSRLALEAGAHGITVHPRPDQRHIRRDDVQPLADLVAGYDGREFNIEGNPFEGDWLDLVLKVRPHQATLVPDDPNQSTSDHGFVADDVERLKPVVAKLKDVGCRVSVFVDPVPGDASAMAACGTDRIELYTESYANDSTTLPRFSGTAEAAMDVEIGVNAGHDLNLANLPAFVAAMPSLAEVSIGHALVSDAIEHGWADTVGQYLAVLGHGSSTKDERPFWTRASAQRASIQHDEQQHGYSNLVNRQDR